MHLTPDTFPCPTHKHDLTDLVKEALDEEGAPIAFDGWFRSGRAASARPFEVIVTCPGTSAETTHQLLCTGEYR